MAKRYHQSAKDRLAESRGMERHLYRHTGYYEGMEPRRRQEMEDAGMIHEDHSKIANLPQEAMIKPYPYAGAGMSDREELDDTIRGIDRQIDGEDRMQAKLMNPHKY
jgi:hypothetical protein